MKRYYAAAGALLLGTSALAWAQDMDKSAVEPSKTAVEAKSDMSWEKTDTASLTAKSDLAATGDSKLQMASFDKALDGFAKAETDAKFQTASFDTKSDSAWSDAKLQTAAFESKSEMAWADESKLQTASFDSKDVSGSGEAKLQTASMDTKLDRGSTANKVDMAWADTDGKIQTAAFDKTETGMGGPLEETNAASGSVVQPSNADPEHDARGIAVISDPAFVPPGYNGTAGAVGGPDEGAGESYPACTAEVTDNCIQLYESGVHASGAAAQSAGVDDSAGMGGPYEPVENDSAHLAMNGDGHVDSAMGETSDAAVQAADSAGYAAVAGHADYQGVGGPVEAQSGYPPCSPGPGDDRCIQLYERGVTGAGN
jgi:hypothetical protein